MVEINTPDKYDKCACCGETDTKKTANFNLGSPDNIRLSVTLCFRCLCEMQTKMASAFAQDKDDNSVPYRNECPNRCKVIDKLGRPRWCNELYACWDCRSYGGKSESQ